MWLGGCRGVTWGDPENVSPHPVPLPTASMPPGEGCLEEKSGLGGQERHLGRQRKMRGELKMYADHSHFV